MYTPRLSKEKTDPLVLSARNAGQEVAKNCGRVQRKLGCKREWRKREKGERRGEAKKAIRPSRLSAEKKFRGEIVLQFSFHFGVAAFFIHFLSYFLSFSPRNVVDWKSLFCWIILRKKKKKKIESHVNWYYKIYKFDSMIENWIKKSIIYNLFNYLWNNRYMQIIYNKFKIISCFFSNIIHYVN